MTKSERINDMMLYLNDKNSFQLKDICNRYQISKSTALRDIKSLEMIGMPIYSNVGRNGSYGILSNKLLSPIVFNMDEVIALYFSMLTLKAYETTPFHLSVETLKNKFEKCLSKDKIEMLHRMEKVFRLATIANQNRSEYLKEILQYALEEKVCEVHYVKKGTDEQTYYIQFFDITASFGQWYATGYNYVTNKPQAFRCDKIVSIRDSQLFSPKSLGDFALPADQLYREKDAIDFEVGVTTKGVDLFHKEHYPSMELVQVDDCYFIKGFYNKREEKFISDYLISYGEKIVSVNPPELKSLLVKRLEELTEFIKIQY